MSLVPRWFIRFVLAVLAVACTLIWPDVLGHTASTAAQAQLVTQVTGGSSGLIYGMVLGGALICAIPWAFNSHLAAVALASGAVGAVSVAWYLLANSAPFTFAATAVTGLANMAFYAIGLYCLALAFSFKEAACVSLAAFALKSAALPFINLIPSYEALLVVGCAIPLIAGGAFALAIRNVLPEGEPRTVGARAEKNASAAVAAIALLSCVAYSMMRGTSALGHWGTPSPLQELGLTALLAGTAAYLVFSYATYAYAPDDILLKFTVPLACLLLFYLVLASGTAVDLGLTADRGVLVLEHFAELYGHMFWWLVTCAVVAFYRNRAMRVAGACVLALSCSSLVISLIPNRPNALWMLLVTYAVLAAFILYSRHAREMLQVSALKQAASTVSAANQQDALEMVAATLAERFGLSPREREVLTLLAQGWSRERIGDQLGLAEGSVGTYCARLYKKMRVHGKQELLTYVYNETEQAVR